MRLWVLLVTVLLVFVTMQGALSDGVTIDDPCYNGSAVLSVALGFTPGADLTTTGILIIQNSCEAGNVVQWTEPINLTLGNITENQVIVSDTFIYVDSVARPDLDQPAKLTFRNTPFAVRPSVFVDGIKCGQDEGCANETWDPSTRTFEVSVEGFSNYSLQGRQDFTVYSDPEPELKSRVYQTIDLNDSNRGTQFKCVVQIYGENQNGAFVLVQTNPERKVAAKLWGSPDTNNPESLGYFPTENGLANVYFNGQDLAGYQDLEYVVQCASNATSLVYEESLSTRYSPAGRSLVGRGVWFTSDSNAFFVIIAAVIVVLGTWIGVNIYRRTFGR